MNQNALSHRAGAGITAMLVTVIALAGEQASYGPQTRHVHGSAQLNLVREGGVVHIELISPAVNLFGFEHAPASEAEHVASQRALSTLRDAARLFRFDSTAACRIAYAEVTPGSTLTTPAADTDPDHHHEADDDGHGDTHHTDITASYRFVCDAADGPVTLHIGLFDAFPAIEGLVVQYIGVSRQGGTILNRNEPALTF